jgi:hypothetical protein
VFVLTLVLVVIGSSWVLTRQQSEGVPVTRPDYETTLSERDTPPDTTAASLPAEDVPGKDIPDLPRYPGSVRIEYEHENQEVLRFTRVRYLSQARVDVIRGFYRGVFRAEGWNVANVEFSEEEWTFLLIQGEKEGEIGIEPHRRGITMVVMQFSEPAPPEKETGSKKTPQKREASPATEERAPLPSSRSATPTPASAPQSASPAPQSASPAPAADDYAGGGDDFGDDEGGDD